MKRLLGVALALQCLLTTSAKADQSVISATRVVHIQYVDCSFWNKAINVAVMDYTTRKFYVIRPKYVILLDGTRKFDLEVRPGIYQIHLTRPGCSANATIAVLSSGHEQTVLVAGRPIVFLGSFGSIFGETPEGVSAIEAICTSDKGVTSYSAAIYGNAYQITGIALPASCQVRVRFPVDPPFNVALGTPLRLGRTTTSFAPSIRKDITINDVSAATRRCAAMMEKLHRDSTGMLNMSQLQC